MNNVDYNFLFDMYINCKEKYTTISSTVEPTIKKEGGSCYFPSKNSKVGCDGAWETRLCYCDTVDNNLTSLPVVGAPWGNEKYQFICKEGEYVTALAESSGPELLFGLTITCSDGETQSIGDM
eukprot:Awhi_evm1s9447